MVRDNLSSAFATARLGPEGRLSVSNCPALFLEIKKPFMIELLVVGTVAFGFWGYVWSAGLKLTD
jgi:hypothetical protein